MDILTPELLKANRAIAMRKRVWYKALDKLERGIMNLTIRIVEGVRSITLVRELVKILTKIKDACKSAFIQQVECYGLKKAFEIIAQVKTFGGQMVDEWLIDETFARLLTLNQLHNPPGWS